MYPSPDDSSDWEDLDRVYDPRGGDSSVDVDEELATRMFRALRCDPRIYGRYLELQVQNRVVILLGELGSEEARTAAVQRAWSVAGVYDVCNRLEVSEIGS